LSHPRRYGGGKIIMKESNCGDIGYLEQLEEIEADCLRSIEILNGALEKGLLIRYRAGIPALLGACRGMIRRAREERARFGLWCAEGREPEEVLKEFDDELERMIGNFECEKE
jgi:hypothetical protein